MRFSLLRAMTFVVVAAALMMAPTIAQANEESLDPYTVTISPSQVAGGSTTVFTFVLADGARSDSSIGSAKLTAPSGFNLTAASLPPGAGTATIAGNVVQLKNTNVQPGRSLNVSITATAPSSCSQSTYTWGSAVWQGTSLSGESLGLGNPGSAQQTTVTSACAVVFGVQPQNTLVTQAITGTAYSPTGPAITAEVVDQGGHVVTSSTAPITVALGNNPGGSTLGGTTTVNAVNGVASFTGLSLNKPADGYTLSASSPGLTGSNSSSFNESSAGTVCPQNQTCTTTVTTTASSLQVTATPDTSQQNAGFLEESVNSGTPLQCSGYTQEDPNWWQFFMSNVNRSKTLHNVITNPILPLGVNTIPAVLGQTKYCYDAPYEFTTSSGTPAPPDGSGGFIGLLPSCPAAGPCMSKTTQLDLNNGLGFDVVINVSVPEGLAGDPRGRA